MSASTGSGSGEIDLTWPAAGGCTTGYYVYYSKVNNSYTVSAGQRESDGVIQLGSVTAYTLGGLTADTVYYIWLYSYGPGDSQSAGTASDSATSGP